jgi:hypothetical protein
VLMGSSMDGFRRRTGAQNAKRQQVLPPEKRPILAVHPVSHNAASCDRVALSAGVLRPPKPDRFTGS